MKTNKLPYMIGGSILVALLGILVITNQSKQPETQNMQVAATSSPQTNAQDPQDIVPGLYKNLIQNTATNEGFVIESIAVENNTSPTGKPESDHLEFTLKNTAGKDLSNFEVYYTITDPVTNKKEGYYKKLNGFTLKSGQSAIIQFDNKPGAGHFTANRNSIYYTSVNKLQFEVIVSSPGYKVQNTQDSKSEGGAELKD